MLWNPARKRVNTRWACSKQGGGYLDLLAFLDEHTDALVLDGQGGFDFATAEAGRSYDALVAELKAAEARLQGAIEAHQRVLSGA